MTGYALLCLGGMLVNNIATADVMEVLLPIWTTKRETAAGFGGASAR